jgi:hypothetical protein
VYVHRSGEYPRWTSGPVRRAEYLSDVFGASRERGAPRFLESDQLRRDPVDHAILARVDVGGMSGGLGAGAGVAVPATVAGRPWGQCDSMCRAQTAQMTSPART